MHQKRFWTNSRSFPERSNISWIATQHWSNWRRIHPDGQGRAERFHLSNDERWILSIQKELVDLSQNIWQKWTDETPVRLQRSVNQITPSSPRAWKRATRTDSLLAISEMTSVVFFIQHILVVVERFMVELMTSERAVVPFLPNTFRSETFFFCCNFSHFLKLISTHVRGSSRKFGVRTSRVMCNLHALMCLFWLSATSPLPLFAVHLLSYHLVFLPDHHLHLPRCEGQIHCEDQDVHLFIEIVEWIDYRKVREGRFRAQSINETFSIAVLGIPEK